MYNGFVHLLNQLRIFSLLIYHFWKKAPYCAVMSLFTLLFAADAVYNAVRQELIKYSKFGTITDPARMIKN